jgi:hypothetical protein
MEQKEAQYLSPDAMIHFGKAPGMHYKVLNENSGIKEYVLIFSKGDEVTSGLHEFATQNKIFAARFTAIGALSSATIAWFDMDKKSYKLNSIDEQVELISLIGDIALYDNKPVIHAHLSVGFSDGSMKGGHLVEAVCNPTVELFITVYPVPLEKKINRDTNLKLIDPEL